MISHSCVCVYLCAPVLIEFKIQPLKETHSTCGQTGLIEEDTSSKSAPSNSHITMRSIRRRSEGNRTQKSMDLSFFTHCLFTFLINCFHLRARQTQRKTDDKQTRVQFIYLESSTYPESSVTQSSATTGRNIRHGLAASATICIFLFA